MDANILIPLLVIALIMPIAATEGDSCTSSSDCDTGEWCEAYKCKYYPCTTDADCPTCGRCAGGVCFRSGSCAEDGPGDGDGLPILGTVEPIEPMPMPPMIPSEPEGSPWEIDNTVLFGVIGLLVLVIAVLVIKRR